MATASFSRFPCRVLRLLLSLLFLGRFVMSAGPMSSVPMAFLAPLCSSEGECRVCMSVKKGRERQSAWKRTHKTKTTMHARSPTEIFEKVPRLLDFRPLLQTPKRPSRVSLCQ